MAARGSREQLQRVVAAWLTRQAYEFAADRNPTHALFSTGEPVALAFTRDWLVGALTSCGSGLAEPEFGSLLKAGAPPPIGSSPAAIASNTLPGTWASASSWCPASTTKPTPSKPPETS
jgi:hypothetical protein